LKDHDIIIQYQNGKIFIIKEISKYLHKLYTNSSFAYHFEVNIEGSIPDYSTISENWMAVRLRNENISVDYEMVLEDVGMESGELIQFGVNGNTTYDLILEEVNGELTLVPYVRGTYVAPPPTTITFQPINR
jgi:hypothetical protein